MVRHGGREVVFDWASEMEKSPATVQWAAFFSDCEHEVLEVTAGHRVTMTYNLYWTPQGPASMADHLGALDPQSLSFYSAIKELLECPEFLPQGKYSTRTTNQSHYPGSADHLIPQAATLDSPAPTPTLTPPILRGTTCTRVSRVSTWSCTKF